MNTFHRGLQLFLILISLLAFQPVLERFASAKSGRQQPSAPATTTKSPQEPPTVEQILEKYIEAIGGKAAVQAQTSCVMKGSLSVPAIGAEGTIEIYAKAPNKQLTEIASSALGNSREGFNGTTAWAEESGEVKDSPGFAKRDADFYLPIRLREIYPKMKLNGKEKVGDIQAYVLEAPRGGSPKRWYFDTETGLLVRSEARDSSGKVIEREDYEDYRAVDGVKVAFTTRSLEEGLDVITKFTVVKHNIPIDDAKFEKPGAKSATESNPSAAPLSPFEQEAAGQLKAATVRDVTTALTAKEMEGRGTAQPGGERAAKYLGDRFARIGLKPGGDQSTYLQRIKFKIETVQPESSFKVGDTAFKYKSDFALLLPLPTEPREVSGKLVFVGFGVVSDELKRDDLAGIDVKGKIVVMLSGGKPKNVDAAVWDKATKDKVRIGRLVEKGAVGFVVVYVDERGTLPFPVAVQYRVRRSVTLAETPQTPTIAPTVMISDSAAEKLLGAPGRTCTSLRQIAESGEFVSRDLKLPASISPRVKREDGTGSNVIGIVEGSDAKLKDEAVVYATHYDAFGIEADGTIYPGAADNALGVGKLIALAEVFANMKPKPRRSIIFMAPTAEEYGDLGSEYWLQHPNWQLEKIAANITYDGIGTDVWGKLAFILDLNFKDSDLNEVVKGVATAAGVEIIPDTSGEEVFYRSDHYSFIKKGIPALFLVGGPGEDISQRAEQFLTTHYHMATDTVQPNWDWEGARMLAVLGLISGMRIANQDAMPVWKAASPYNRPRGARPPSP
jgi:Peptidase family M28/PA domain